MAHVSSGGAATSAEYNAQDDRIANLENTVATTGGTVGTASLDANEGWREESGTTSENGRVTVTHSLGFTPRVFIQMRGSGGPYTTYVITPTSTEFTVQFYALSTGAPAAEGQGVTFDWLGKKGDSV